MKIGNVHIGGYAALAPMAGVTDLPFRVICRECGAGIVYTEFVSAEGIVRGNRRTIDYMALSPDERPAGIQIFGGTPEVMAGAARAACTLGPDLIDINIGCPVPKIVKRNAGAALLKDLPRLAELVAAVVEASSVPVTAKIRSGWDQKNIVAVPAAQVMEERGVQAITIHPRTQTQRYDGTADWSQIALVKQSLSIPVIGNGDIRSAQDAERMMETTGCDYVMIGRAALGNPWIFEQVNRYIRTGTVPPAPTRIRRIEGALEHLERSLALRSEYDAVIAMKKHIGWYTKGMANSSALRQAVMKTSTAADVRELLIGFRDNLREHEHSLAA